MRRLLLLLLLLLAVCQFYSVVGAGQGLVSPQSACRIRCENGGMCVFDLDRPKVHSCICLLGVFTGDRCQTRIAQEPSATEAPSTQRPQTHYPDNEEARRLDEQRKREYEKRVAEQARREKEAKDRAAEEERRRQQHAQYWREETARREAERRRVEDERRRQQQRQQDELERRKQIEEQNARDEQRRLHEKHQHLIIKQQEMESQRKLKEQEHEDDKVEEQWEYPDVDEDMDYVENVKHHGNSENMEEDRHTKDIYDDQDPEIDSAESDDMEATTPRPMDHENSMDESNEEPLSPEQEKVISVISKVIEKAVDETIKQHPIEESTDDDYWDHTPPKTDDDYARDNDESRLGKADDGEEYSMEEGQEGWMMVKKEEQNSSKGVTIFSVLLTILISYMF
ncbi:unnamed protein product [Caenorhabditis bovis]|uniref:EGF-like domain-containing protein n=1 Tax=Caenorhabditis bovis TaxID=2654633 RepID=A0A8S1EPM4_9PELO|nr:unnamed protein product [Caenorhabditis bovis]